MGFRKKNFNIMGVVFSGVDKKPVYKGWSWGLGKRRGFIPPMSKVGGWGILRNGGSYSEGG